MFLSYSCGAVVNVFPTAAFSDDVCMYPFPSDRCLGCLWSLLSKTMLPRASSHLSPYGLCAKGGDAEPEGMSTLSILQLVLQMLHQLALPQPGLTGSHLPRPCQPLILSDFLILAKLLGKKKKKKMTSDHFNLRIANCYWNLLMLTEPFQNWSQRAKQRKVSIQERTYSSSPRDFPFPHVISWTSADLLLPAALRSTHKHRSKGRLREFDAWLLGCPASFSWNRCPDPLSRLVLLGCGVPPE